MNPTNRNRKKYHLLWKIRARHSEPGGLEIMINNPETKLSSCPLVLFNENKVAEYLQKIYQLIKDGEEFKGDTTIYEKENYVLPGCRYESMVTW